MKENVLVLHETPLQVKCEDEERGLLLRDQELRIYRDGSEDKKHSAEKLHKLSRRTEETLGGKVGLKTETV